MTLILALPTIKDCRQHIVWRMFEVRLEEQSTEKQNLAVL